MGSTSGAHAQALTDADTAQSIADASHRARILGLSEDEMYLLRKFNIRAADAASSTARSAAHLQPPQRPVRGTSPERAHVGGEVGGEPRVGDRVDAKIWTPPALSILHDAGRVQAACMQRFTRQPLSVHKAASPRRATELVDEAISAQQGRQIPATTSPELAGIREEIQRRAREREAQERETKELRAQVASLQADLEIVGRETKAR